MTTPYFGRWKKWSVSVKGGQDNGLPWALGPLGSQKFEAFKSEIGMIQFGYPFFLLFSLQSAMGPFHHFILHWHAFKWTTQGATKVNIMRGTSLENGLIQTHCVRMKIHHLCTCSHPDNPSEPRTCISNEVSSLKSSHCTSTAKTDKHSKTITTSHKCWLFHSFLTKINCKPAVGLIVIGKEWREVRSYGHLWPINAEKASAGNLHVSGYVVGSMITARTQNNFLLRIPTMAELMIKEIISYLSNMCHPKHDSWCPLKWCLSTNVRCNWIFSWLLYGCLESSRIFIVL